MVSHKILGSILVLLGLGAAFAFATEVVGVSGSSVRYATPIDAQIGDQQVKLVLTGTALRKKLIVSVYAIASYVREGVPIRTAEELAAVDCPKRLHLVLERDVAGKDMAEAFHTAIRQNYAAPLFADEIKLMVDLLQAHEARQGTQVWLTHVPAVGLEIQVLGKGGTLIRNPAFSRAVWDIYFGKNNLGESIKQGLVSRLRS